MKKIISMVLTAAMLLTASSTVNASVIYMGDVTDEMTDASYWYSKVENPDEVLADHPIHYSKDEKMLFFEKDGERVNMLFTGKEEKTKAKESIRDKLNKGKLKSEATKTRDLPKKNRDMTLG